MTDDGSGCNAKLFAGACRWLGLKRSRTKPSTPRSNGRAERFIQTPMREWVHMPL